jgi:hypothetical protein
VSAGPRAWVQRNKPYRRTEYVACLTLADLANERNGWEIWATTGELAERANISRSMMCSALRRFVADGVLEVVEYGGSRRLPTRYRWVPTSASFALAKPATSAVVALDMRGTRASTSAVVAQRTRIRTRREPEKKSADKPRAGARKPEPSVLALVAEEPASAPKERRPRARDPLYDALVAALGIDYERATGDQRRSLGQTTAQLRKAQAQPDELARWVTEWRRRNPRGQLTHMVIRHHWGDFDPPSAAEANRSAWEAEFGPGWAPISELQAT